MAPKAIVQAVIGRLVLMSHSALVVVYLAYIEYEAIYALLSLLSLVQIVEGVYMVAWRSGYEYKWVSLSTLCYLLSVVPQLVLLEESRLQTFFDSNNNATILQHRVGDSEDIVGHRQMEKLWMEILRQTLLLAIMLHRWIIPRGSLTRDSLSQLLFVFFATASDITELFELFTVDKVMANRVLGYFILTAWCLSLFQMSVVLTNTREVKENRDDDTISAGGRKQSRNADDVENQDKNPDTAADQDAESHPDDQSEDDNEPPVPACCLWVMETDLWSMLLTLFTMDLPFLIVRLYIIGELQVYSYGILFFTVKNMLVICLSIYRLVIVCGGRVVGTGTDGRQERPPQYRPSFRKRQYTSIRGKSVP